MTRNQRNTTKASIAAMITALCGSVGAANAQVTYEWVGLGDGVNFTDPQNWLPVGVPGVADEAKFDANATHSVQFAAARSNATCSVENDTARFFLNGRTYTAAELVVGDRLGDVGMLTVDGGVLRTTTGLAQIGKVAPSDGRLIVTNASTLNTQRDLIVGDGGDGYFQLDAGCVATSLITFVADESNSSGEAVIRGTWNVQNSALIGNGGVALLRVESGGTMTVGSNTKVGDNAGSFGTLEVDGAGAQLISGGVTTIGNFGRGVLTVSNGGRLSTPGLRIADDFRGDVSIDGGTLIDSAGTFVGNRANGSLTLANSAILQSPLVTVTTRGTLAGSGTINGASVNEGAVSPGNGPGILNVSGNYTQTLGTLNIELGGASLGSEYDQLAVAGTAVLGGTLNVTLINGYNPSSGEFVIVSGGNVSGSFATENLPAGFSITYEATRVLLSIGDPCIADFNGDGIVNTQDVIRFLNAWASGNSTADINGDGVVNSLDFIAYLNLWVAGC